MEYNTSAQMRYMKGHRKFASTKTILYNYIPVYINYTNKLI